MTKEKIWRLKEQPSTESLRELVKDGILTKDEAREILFREEEKTDRDTESLQSEIKFLRELVQKLAQRSDIVTTIKEIQAPYYRRDWYHPYITWCEMDTENTNLSTGTLTLNGTPITMNGFSSIVTF